MTTLILGATAIANLFSKKVATIYGILFTALLFVIFTVSEQHQPETQVGGWSWSGGIQSAVAAGDGNVASERPPWRHPRCRS